MAEIGSSLSSLCDSVAAQCSKNYGFDRIVMRDFCMTQVPKMFATPEQMVVTPSGGYYTFDRSSSVINYSNSNSAKGVKLNAVRDFTKMICGDDDDMNISGPGFEPEYEPEELEDMSPLGIRNFNLMDALVPIAAVVLAAASVFLGLVPQPAAASFFAGQSLDNNVNTDNYL